MRFMLDNGKFFIALVEVAKPEIFDIADPQPKNTCQQDHSVIPFPDWRGDVNAIDQVLNLFLIPYSGQLCAQPLRWMRQKHFYRFVYILM